MISALHQLDEKHPMRESGLGRKTVLIFWAEFHCAETKTWIAADCEPWRRTAKNKRSTSGEKKLLRAAKARGGLQLLPTQILCHPIAAMLHVIESGCAAERLDVAFRILAMIPLPARSGIECF